MRYLGTLFVGIFLVLAVPYAAEADHRSPCDYRCEQDHLYGNFAPVIRGSDVRITTPIRTTPRAGAPGSSSGTTGGTSGGTDANGFGPPVEGTNPAGFGQSVPFGQQASALTEAGDMLGCGSAGEFGGAISGILDNALKGLVGSVVGQATGRLRELLGSVASHAGPLAPLLNRAIDSVIGRVEQTLTQLGESAISSVSESLGLGPDPVSGVARALGLNPSSALSSLGINVAGSAAGLGAGLAAGLAGGAVSVPVDVVGRHVALQQSISDYSVRIEGRLDIIEQIQRNDIYVTCVLDPTVSEIRNQLLEHKSAAMLEWNQSGNEGLPVFVQHRNTDITNTTEFRARQLIEDRTAGICSNVRADVQRIALNQWVYERDYGKQVQCSATGAVAAERGRQVPDVDVWWECLFDLNCSDQHVLYRTRDELNKIAAETALTHTIEYVKNEGYYNRCREDRDAGVGAFCLDGHVVAHGSQIKESIDNTLNIANQQLVAADEIGELIDSLMQGLEQFIFENIDGFLGFALEAGSSEREYQGEEAAPGEEGYTSEEEGGSYVEELVREEEGGGGGEGGATDSFRGILASDIRGALETERAYFELLDLVITDLEAVQQGQGEVRACYVPIATSGSATVSATTARDIVNLASSTVATVVRPQLTELYIEARNSETSIAELLNLLDAAESALTIAETVTVSNSFTALKESGLMHNATDLEHLVRSVESSAIVIETLMQEARIKLAVCRGT